MRKRSDIPRSSTQDHDDQEVMSSIPVFTDSHMITDEPQSMGLHINTDDPNAIDHWYSTFSYLDNVITSDQFPTLSENPESGYTSTSTYFGDGYVISPSNSLTAQQYMTLSDNMISPLELDDRLSLLSLRTALPSNVDDQSSIVSRSSLRLSIWLTFTNQLITVFFTIPILRLYESRYQHKTTQYYSNF